LNQLISKTQGIVISHIAYSETSVIAKIFTEHFGMQSYMIKAVRKTNARIKMVMLQPLTLIEFVTQHKPNKTIHYITDITTAPAYQTIPYDVTKSALAFFIAEVIGKSIREEEANLNLFEFIKQHLLWFDAHNGSNKQFHHYFLLQLTQHLGFFPDGVYDVNHTFFDLREGVFAGKMPMHPDFISLDEANVMHQFIQSKLHTHHQIPTNNAIRKTLLNNILKYYYHHNLSGSTIKSHLILEAVFD
jgi:DNA repair protein RecO (recombination protein O)